MSDIDDEDLLPEEMDEEAQAVLEEQHPAAAGLPAATPLPEQKKPRNVGGRPSKFDPVKAAQIVEDLKHGNYVETAAARAGVSKVTVYAWLRRGARARSGPFADFAKRVEAAQAEAENMDLLRMEALAAKRDFRAIAWRLERRNPRRWGAQVQITVHQALDEYLGYLQSSLDPDTFEKVLASTMAWDGNAVPRAVG